MPAHNQAVGDGALPLTVINLDSIRPTSQTDKAKLVRNFVKSQEVYLARYSKEGCAAAASWDRDSPDAKGNTPIHNASSRDVIVSAFDTPILKPRVPASVELIPERVAQSKSRMQGLASEVQATETRPLKASKAKHLVRPESQKENVSAAPVGRKERRCGQQDISKAAPARAQQQTLDRYSKVDKQNEAPPRKRRRSPDSTDTEHAARLAERRERRRVKRAIVAPKAPIDAASDEEHVSASGAMKATKATKGNKKKSTSLAAGLALMHGFTAKNVGKNRLTVQPERRNGVFSKGRASTKVGISKKRNTTVAFSESHFLSAVKRPTESREKASGEASSEDSDHSTLSRTSAAGLIFQKTTLPGCRGRKALGLSEHHSDASVDQSQPGNTRPASIVWDIEADGKSLSSDSEPSELDNPPDGTLVLNTHAKKWTADAPDLIRPVAPTHAVSDGRLPSCEAQTAPLNAVEASADHASTVSLQPSDSASQLPRHLRPSAPYVSKFFPSFPAAPGDSANVEPMSAVGEEEMYPSQLSSRRADFVSPPPLAGPPAGNVDMLLASSSQLSTAQQAMDTPLSGMYPSASRNPVSISASVLDRELRALDDDDHGLLYAVYRQEHTSEECCSALSLTQMGPRHERSRTYSDLHSIGDNGFESTLSAPSSSIPDVYTQAEYQYMGTEHWDFATDAEAGSIYPADLLDDDGYDNWQIDVDGTAMALASDEYFAEAMETLGFSPVLEALPFDDDAYMSESQGFDEAEQDYLASDSRLHTAASWCSEPEGPIMSSPDPSIIARASELSAELHVPSFAQGRDLLLGLSERSSIERNPYSITSVEEDVAKNLRGHWLPQRL